jgi:oxepin-CoA hydrolase/3-oxo-5,6-dehydrosuberyl-CoA semialdehyde dehydrogenase
MVLIEVQSFAAGKWLPPAKSAARINSAITGEPIAICGHSGLDFQAIRDFAIDQGGNALREMTFHQRAQKLKDLATYLNAQKQHLYDLSYDTGGTLSDHKIDIDGGIGTVFLFASKGRRELPDAQIYLDGDIEQLSKNGTFLGQHICTPLQGVAVHINAFNFPVWGMLEKLAPCILAGVPAIVKPATATCQVAEACFRMIVESGILPDGAVQFIAGSTGDLLDRLQCQDAVSFTGSAQTALMLRANANILRNSVRFTSEQDSLNASVLGPDVQIGSPEFDLFVTEVTREMATKAGQKCTAIRRIFAPQNLTAPLCEAISEALGKIRIGDPRLKETQMGALVSRDQKADVLAKSALIAAEAKLVYGDETASQPMGIDPDKGAFVTPKLFFCSDPTTAKHIHQTEAFGPVATVVGYNDTANLAELVNRGGGSLVASVITHDPQFAAEISIKSASYHGRLYFNNRDSMAESTGHGSPLPHMVHGGPGRAGGGEELGGMRGVMHYMQRTAIQGSPEILSAIGRTWVPGSPKKAASKHPFTRSFTALELGESLHTGSRIVTLDDIETFAHFTGDTFYAHMDEEAAKANPFFPGRVAHGYLLLSFAAGLFVEPNPGPVLANTGLNNLRFQKPVSPGESISAQLTVRQKTKRNAEYGEVKWHVALVNQDGDQVAEYELLTMNAL